MQHLGGDRRIVVVLRRGEGGVVEEGCLGDGDLDLIGRLNHVLERILEVVRGVDHVGDVGHPPIAVLEQLDDDEEELVGVDRTDGEVVVAVLRVVEVEAAEPADHRQPADDLLDVRVRQMVAEVDEAGGAVPGALGEEQRRTPVGIDR